jgi:hypothetical protein
MPTIVLTDFIRSCSADGNAKGNREHHNMPQAKKSVGLTEKRAGRMAGMTV